MMLATTVLETKNLAVGYNGTAVLNGIDLKVRAGEIATVLGRNGVGKTTTLQTIAGVLPPINGNVYFEGRPISGPLYMRARKGISLIPETRAVVRRLSVIDNLRLGQSAVDRAFHYFPELRPLSNRMAGLLSGGEQQMLALARVLACAPKLILVDELSFGLAPLIVERLLESLRREVDSNATAVLLIEQHPVAALTAADRGYVFTRDGVAMEDTSQNLLSQLSEIERSYLSTA